MSNYPLGAENDSQAPYNEPLPQKRTVTISITLSKDVEVEIPGDSQDPLEDAKEYVHNCVLLPAGVNLVMENGDTDVSKDWVVDDLEICF